MIHFLDKTTDWLDKENANVINPDVRKVFDVILHGKVLVNPGETY